MSVKNGVSRRSRGVAWVVADAAAKEVEIETIHFDPSYQRDVVPSVVKSIANNFDTRALGVPIVGQREDGSLWGVDGRQRLTALANMGRKWCRVNVFKSEGPEHEAKIFRLINKNRKPLNPAQIFQARLTEGDEEAWDIKRIVEAEGFILSKQGGGSRESTPEHQARLVMCIAAVQRVYKLGKEKGLRFVLSTLRDAWPDDPTRIRDVVVLGLYTFWRRLEGEVDAERLVARLRGTQPGKLIYSSTLGTGERHTVMADVIERLYRRRKAPAAA